MFLMCEACGEKDFTVKRVGAKWAWSDRGRAVADLRVEFVGHLVRPRLLQHVVLHDRLLVGVDGRVRVVGVVPRLVPAGLIGRLRGHGLFALTAQQVAADTNQEVVFTPSLSHNGALRCSHLPEVGSGRQVLVQALFVLG